MSVPNATFKSSLCLTGSCHFGQTKFNQVYNKQECTHISWSVLRLNGLKSNSLPTKEMLSWQARPLHLLVRFPVTGLQNNLVKHAE